MMRIHFLLQNFIRVLLENVDGLGFATRKLTALQPDQKGKKPLGLRNNNNNTE